MGKKKGGESKLMRMQKEMSERVAGVFVMLYLALPQSMPKHGTQLYSPSFHKQPCDSFNRTILDYVLTL